MALDEILRNFPIKWLGVVVRNLLFPLGLSLRKPNDYLTHRVAALMIRPGEARDRLTEGLYISNDPDDITGCLEDALQKVIEAEPIERRLRHDGLEQGELEEYEEWIDTLVRSEQVSKEEADILLAARAATRRVIMVDDFTPEQMIGNRGNPDQAVAKAKPAIKKTVTKKAVKKKTAAKAKRGRKETV